MYYSAKELGQEIQKKSSYLCIGLDPDLTKIPDHLKRNPDPVFEFCRQIIDSTHDICISYKPNLAFFEALGPEGFDVFRRVCEYIPTDLFVIADAKRGDIGNTANKYASAFFDNYAIDALTINPYMGFETVLPFLEFEEKYAIVLGLTSNQGSNDLQKKILENGVPLFEEVIMGISKMAKKDKVMFVVGATQGESFKKIRSILSENFLLVPGIGSQGGNLEEVSKNGFNKNIGLIVNSSRSIIFAGQDQNFASAARKSAMKIQEEMANLLNRLT
jgi:orotidine-5'-phosphate decarboxylase